MEPTEIIERVLGWQQSLNLFRDGQLGAISHNLIGHCRPHCCQQSEPG